MKPGDNLTPEMPGGDISRLVALIYETILEPDLRSGLSEKADSTFSTAHTIEKILDHTLVEQALPHIEHAFELAYRQQSSPPNPPEKGIPLSHLPLPVCIISRSLVLLSANQKAKIMLHNGAGLPRPADQALVISYPLKKELLHAVTCAIDSRKIRTLNCQTSSDILQTILVVPSYSYTDNDVITEPFAEVLFLNFRNNIDELKSALINIYGLTPSEAQVTAHLTQGASLEQIAKEKGSSLNTVRSQIKRVYEKTGTQRQGQLISLALNGPALWLNIIEEKDRQQHESPPVPSESEKTFKLTDGRTIGYGDYGPKTGKPVLLCHHILGSRKEKPSEPGLLEKLGIRLIVPERPGVGFSSPAEDRSLLEWAEDIRQLSDHLHLEHFHVAGLSAGGPYAAACAAQLGERVIKLGMISSQMPVDELPLGVPIAYIYRFMTTLARRWPTALQKILELRYSKLLQTPEHAIVQLTTQGNAADRALLEDFQINQFRRQCIVDASRLPTSIFAKELITLAQPWGFELSKLTLPVMVWHGKQDDFFPAEHAIAMAKLIPNCQAICRDDWGHCFLFSEWESILSALVH